MRRILVTTALPYVNGSIHIGHLLEHIQTDIWTRYQRLMGNECYLVSADDTHGTATMLRADAENTSPEELIKRVQVEHEQDLRKFGCSYEDYYTTHSEENKHYSELIYRKLVERGCIFKEDVEQLFDTQKGLFLADRYVRGTCPRCGAEDQPGDNCDNCGATYAATSLINPRSVLSDSTPILKNSEHIFFDLTQFEDFLRNWTTSGAVEQGVANKLKEWLDGGLRPWDISRDAPYFGFRIPDTDDKYFYVWMDAPVGYMASFQHWCTKSGIAFEDFWAADSTAELHHFIGKDIVNFHALFWPAVLSTAGFRTPTRVHVHGYITVDGAKMSKSKGTFVNATTFCEYFDPEILRYFYASRLSSGTADIDINFNDLVTRVNSDLVGKFVNIAARCSSFLAKNFNSTLAAEMSEPALFDTFTAKREEIAALYESGEFARVVREVMALADQANQYLAKMAPWTLIKDPSRHDEVQQICTLAINLFRVLLIYLKPVVPELSERGEKYLSVDSLTWSDIATPLLDHELGKFERLMTRADAKNVPKMLAASRVLDDERGVDGDEHSMDVISIDDFAKVSLRAAKVIEANYVDGSNKLLRLRLDVGDHEREVLSGIRDSYIPEQLVGRYVVVVANLAPRKMRFGTSQGMVLAAGDDADGIFLIAPDEGVKPGMAIS